MDVDQPRSVALSRHFGWPRRFGWPDRGVASALVTKAGARLAVASIHLPLIAAQRPEHALRARDVLDSYGHRFQLAAGDLNEEPPGPAWDAFSVGGLADLDPECASTYSATRPFKRIDGILATEGVEVVEHRVLDGAAVTRASDHRPVLAVIRLTVT
jgi:endonuclease/exonuclease/phosphatase family metal-dependent hydrolase